MSALYVRVAIIASDLIAGGGWVQNVERMPTNGPRYQYDLLGACREAAGVYEAETEAARLTAARAAEKIALGALEAAEVPPGTTPTEWNDDPYRTAAEVIEALRAYALKAWQNQD